MYSTWSSLSNAPPPDCHQEDGMTLCEFNACMANRSNPEARSLTSKVVQCLPVILAASSGDPCRSSGSSSSKGQTRFSAKSAFLTPKQRDSSSNKFKVFFSLWNEEGILGALNQVLGDQSNLTLAAKTLLSLYNYLTISLYGSIRPGISVSSKDKVIAFTYFLLCQKKIPY